MARFKGWKGYVPALPQEGASLIVADADRRAHYLRQGYVKIGPCKGDRRENDTGAPRAYYQSTVGGRRGSARAWRRPSTRPGKGWRAQRDLDPWTCGAGPRAPGRADRAGRAERERPERRAAGGQAPAADLQRQGGLTGNCHRTGAVDHLAEPQAALASGQGSSSRDDGCGRRCR